MMASLSISHPKLAAPKKVLRIIRTLACKGKSTSSDVWIARLEAETRLASRAELEQAWDDARHSVAGPGMETVWMWGVERDGEHGMRVDLMEELLKETMRDSSLRSIHDILLMKYMKELMQTTPADDTGYDTVVRGLQHVTQMFMATSQIWGAIFAETRSVGKNKLQAVFEQWRQVDGREATVNWATWLMENGHGEEAKEAVMRERRRDGEKEDERWAEILRVDYG